MIKTFLRAMRIWLAIKLLGQTGYIAVPAAEVKRVTELCDELETYAVHSGALSDPRRCKARKRIGALLGDMHTAARSLPQLYQLVQEGA